MKHSEKLIAAGVASAACVGSVSRLALATCAAISPNFMISTLEGIIMDDYLAEKSITSSGQNKNNNDLGTNQNDVNE